MTETTTLRFTPTGPVGTDKNDRLTFAGSIYADGRRLRGSVQLAGQQTPRNGELVEVDPAALVKADASKAVLSVGHQAGADMSLGYDPLRIVARADNSSLQLNRTEQGFDYATDALPNTTYANDVLELARSGLLGGTSFEIQGLRSTFSTNPDGIRVRRYTSIDTLSAITPVVEPAFPSSVAAFSKEHSVTEPIVEPKAPEPKVEPPKAEPPAVVFTAEPTLFERTLGFAKTLNDDQLKAAVAGAWAEAGDEPDGLGMQRIEAYTKEAEDRRISLAKAEERRRELKFRRDLTLGIAPKAPNGTSDLFASDDYKAAFGRYLRTGDKQVMEPFAQSIAGDGTQGGYMVPDGFLTRIVETQKAYGGIARVADSITTSDGIPLRWASNDDTANVAAIAAEGSAGSTGADKVFGEVTLGAFSYDATGASNLPLKVSKELLQDAAFDVESFIGRNLGTRIGRKQAADFATGDGSSKPTGLLAKTPDVMSATTLLAALIEHHFQVDAAYRDGGNCKWVLSDTTLAKAYGSVDGNGRPLFIPEAQSGGSDRPAGMLLGYPVIIDNGAGDLVAFGDIRQGFIIRYVRGVQVDVDPYTYISTRQIGFHAWARADSNVQDAAAYSVSDYSSVNADS